MVFLWYKIIQYINMEMDMPFLKTPMQSHRDDKFAKTRIYSNVRKLTAID